MSKKTFYKTINMLTYTNRIDNEEAYIINDYVSSLESIIKELQKKTERPMKYNKYSVFDLEDKFDKENKNGSNNI